MFILVTFSPGTQRVEADIHKAIGPHGLGRFNLPGSAIVMKCGDDDAAEAARLALVSLREQYNGRGKAFEYMWMRINPTDFAHHPRAARERPGWKLELLAEIVKRDA